MAIPVNTKENLLQLLHNHSGGIKSFGVKRLGLFGSFARNTGIHGKSDVDLLVEFESGKKSYDNFMDLAAYLEELLARKVELVTPQSLSKFIGPYILKQVQDVEL
jgi:predicted nucleotidyltransferase